MTTSQSHEQRTFVAVITKTNLRLTELTVVSALGDQGWIACVGDV